MLYGIQNKNVFSLCLKVWVLLVWQTQFYLSFGVRLRARMALPGHFLPDDLPYWSWCRTQACVFLVRVYTVAMSYKRSLSWAE